jgi:arsenite methyltransferase
MQEEKIKEFVKERYGKIAKRGDISAGNSCCSAKSCCGDVDSFKDASIKIGYSDKEIDSVPKGANLGLGCGNPVAIASLKEGETILDLGSGAGFDCFLASQKVGRTGRVIGVDMTEEMLLKARENAAKGGYDNVEFRAGEIENLPVDDRSVDAVISNCVINLVPDKQKAFREVFRVLKPGGRFMISDIVLEKDLPDFIKKSAEAYTACISGAIRKNEYIKTIEDAGFHEVKIIDETSFPIDYILNDPLVKTMIENMKIPLETVKDTINSVSSIKVHGIKSEKV